MLTESKLHMEPSAEDDPSEQLVELPTPLSSLDPATVAASSQVSTAPSSPESKEPAEGEEPSTLVLEEKEQDIPKILQGVRERLVNLRQPNFEGVAFDQESVVDVIQQHIGEDGSIKTSPEEFAQQYAEVLAFGLAQALATGDPNKVQGVLGTVASALHVLAQEGQVLSEDSSAVVEATDKIVDELLRRGFAQGSEEFDIDISGEVEEIFGAELEQLGLRNLSPEEISFIRATFDSDILLRRRTGEQLKELRAWVREHVKTPSLRDSLLIDIQDKERQEQSLIDVTARSVPRLLPLTATRGAIVSHPIQSDLSGELENLVQDLTFEINKQRPNLKDIIRQGREKITQLNEFFEERGLHQQGKREVFQIKTSGASAKDIIDTLREAANLIGSQTKTFVYIPTGPTGKPQDQRQLVGDLRRILETPVPRHRGSTKISHPGSLERFGAIIVTTDSRSRVHEIVIPPNSLIMDVLHLSQALVMEDAELKDRSGTEIFNIKKATTKAADIVSYIQKIMTLEAGHAVQLLWTPSAKVGGSYLSGALSVLMKKPLFPPSSDFVTHTQDMEKHALLKMPLSAFTRFKPKVGGAAKVSDIALGIGGVAGGLSAIPGAAIITAPIAAISGIIGGLGKLFGF